MSDLKERFDPSKDNQDDSTGSNSGKEKSKKLSEEFELRGSITTMLYNRIVRTRKPLSQISRDTGISKQNLSRILKGKDIKISQLFGILESINYSFPRFITLWYNIGSQTKMSLLDDRELKDLNDKVAIYEKEISRLNEYIESQKTLVKSLTDLVDQSKKIEYYKDIVIKNLEEQLDNYKTMTEILRHFKAELSNHTK